MYPFALPSGVIVGINPLDGVGRDSGDQSYCSVKSNNWLQTVCNAIAANGTVTYSVGQVLQICLALSGNACVAGWAATHYKSYLALANALGFIKYVDNSPVFIIPAYVPPQPAPSVEANQQPHAPNVGDLGFWASFTGPQ